MSRATKQAYRSSELADLARQLMYTPSGKRIEQVLNAERLHDELDESKNYPIDFVVYRLTGRRIPPEESVMLVGEAIRPDLRLLIDALSRSVEIESDSSDPCETTAELAHRLGVSTKTVGRWRKEGLRWRWGVKQAGGKPRVLFPRSAITAFESAHPQRVDSATRFSRISTRDKRVLVGRARRLADATDCPPQEIYRHLSKRSGRSVEAIRLLITQHDEAKPDQAVFIDRASPLTPKQKRLIDRAYQRGVTVTALCDRLRKTRSTIYRAIHEARALRTQLVELDAICSPTFDRDDAEEVILRPTRRAGKPRRLDSSVIEALPAALQPIYDRPIDSDRVLKSLLVKYNFLKYRAMQLQELIAMSMPRASDLDRFDGVLDRVRLVRGELIAGVLPVVLSVVLRQFDVDKQTDEQGLYASLDNAHAALLDEIDHFDPSLSHKFESVLTNRLLRVLATQKGEAVDVDADQLFNRLASAGFRMSEISD